MSALVLDATQMDVIEDLIARANQNVISFKDMQARAAATDQSPPQLMKDQTIRLPVSTDVTFTIEEHAPSVPCRHMSVSVSAKAGRAPNPHVVAMLMQHFGFENDLQACMEVGAVWTEKLADDSAAVNVVEPLSGKFSDLKKRPVPDA